MQIIKSKCNKKNQQKQYEKIYFFHISVNKKNHTTQLTQTNASKTHRKKINEKLHDTIIQTLIYTFKLCLLIMLIKKC